MPRSQQKQTKSRDEKRRVKQEKKSQKKIAKQEGKTKTKSSKSKTSKSSETKIKAEKKPHRFHPGTQALRQIRREQKSTKFCVNFAASERLIKELLGEHEIPFNMGGGSFRITAKAVEALREAMEDKVVRIFQDTQLTGIHAKRLGINTKDMQLAIRLSHPELVQAETPTQNNVNDRTPRDAPPKKIKKEQAKKETPVEKKEQEEETETTPMDESTSSSTTTTTANE